MIPEADIVRKNVDLIGKEISERLKADPLGESGRLMLLVPSPDWADN